MTAPVRPAASVCLLRSAARGIEVLMVRRAPGNRFMSGAWVFPGGIVEPRDEFGDATENGPSDDAFVRAGLRELAEETGIWIIQDGPSDPPGLEEAADVYGHLDRAGGSLDVDAPVLFANWITPTLIPLRFDTRFYALEAPSRVKVAFDRSELDAAQWCLPGKVVELADRGERTIAMPTRHILLLLQCFDDPESFLGHARSLDRIRPVLARGRVRPDGSIEAVLPGEPGYDDLEVDPDLSAISPEARAVLRTGHLTQRERRES